MSTKISRRILAKNIAAQLTHTKDTAKLGRQIAGYLVTHKMTDQLDMLLGDIAYELGRQNEHLYVTVTTANGLSDSLKKAIADYLNDRYGKMPVELTEEVDSTLVGGAVITTPDETLDLSVQAKLKRLRQA